MSPYLYTVSRFEFDDRFVAHGTFRINSAQRPAGGTPTFSWTDANRGSAGGNVDYREKASCGSSHSVVLTATRRPRGRSAFCCPLWEKGAAAAFSGRRYVHPGSKEAPDLHASYLLLGVGESLMLIACSRIL